MAVPPLTLDARQHTPDGVRDVVHVGHIRVVHKLVLPRPAMHNQTSQACQPQKPHPVATGGLPTGPERVGHRNTLNR
jgi:hypothetical protein